MIRCQITLENMYRVTPAVLSFQRGVGLIEVLVALLVLSLGFLVSANMQLRGMRANQDTFHHAQAMMLANDIMDRMRNNREGVVDGRYDGMETGEVTKPDCASSGCDSEGLASLDRFEWSANLLSLRDETAFIPMLPTNEDGVPAKGTISAPDGNGVYTVTMSWTRQDGDNEINESLPVKFVP
ncbi:MAG: type IV pilus modification protein PilV [Granulosicoccus sp.]